MAFKTDLPNEDLFIEADPEIREAVTDLVDEIVEAVDELKAAEERAGELKDELRELAKEVYWDVNFQQKAPQHTFDARGKANAIQVNFLNKYDLDKDKGIRIYQLLGKGVALLKHLQEKTIVSVDTSSLEKQQEIECWKELLAVCKKYGVTAVVDDKYTVAPEFHDDRHVLMPEVNQAIDEILPVQVHVTT